MVQAEAFETDFAAACGAGASVGVGTGTDAIAIVLRGLGIGTGDAGPMELTVEAWDLIQQVNLRGMWLTCKHALPVMCAAGRGNRCLPNLHLGFGLQQGGSGVVDVLLADRTVGLERLHALGSQP